MDQKFVSIGATELMKLLDGPRPPVLVDVRLEEDCNASRLPGAVGNCVIEVIFEERMATAASDPTYPVCVYGAGSDSAESRMAAEKLCRQGYAEVYDFSEGLDGWTLARLPTIGSPPGARSKAAVKDGTHPIDLRESNIRWIGRNLLNRHEGLIGLKSGSLEITNGQLAGGEFVIDMRAISCTDLAGTALHDVLIRHLTNNDFFDSGKFPEATVSITSASLLPEATPGSPDLTIFAILTLKGVSGPVEFSASTGVTAEGKLAAQATLAFDRTQWNVLYGSGKWFRHLGGHLVNDRIELHLRIVSE
ncbi:MAG: YceI family protein [Verrucomicrobiota bacterium]